MSPYIPQLLPIEDLDYRRLFSVVGTANAELARYDGLLQGIVNPEIMLSPLLLQEAVLSSRLEGTQATMDDVWDHEAGVGHTTEKRNDIQEVTNYRNALRAGHEYLREMPFNLYFVRSLHRILLDSVRGKDKQPGSFRTTQNMIGVYGCTLETATFVPPAPVRLPEYLENWEAYLAGQECDRLVQCAVMHAQFELLHPFLDGNGRIGRIAIPLFLFAKKMLSQPMFYISSYLESNREDYYRTLNNISHAGDWNGWIEFFLRAIISQARSNSTKVREIIALYEKSKEDVQNATHSQFSIQLLDALFTKPKFRVSDFLEITGIPKTALRPLLKKLQQNGIVEVVSEGRGRVQALMAFPALLRVAEGGEGP